MNFIEGTVAEGIFVTGTDRISLTGYDFTPAGRSGGPAWFGIRPEHVFVGDQGAAMPFTTDVDVELVEPMGADTLVWSTLAGERFRFLVDGGMDVDRGSKLVIGFDPARASLFHKGSEERM